MSKPYGILLTNTGTPDAPTPDAVRRYLREFLSDKRIVQIPRLLWLPILYGLILPFRSKKSARLYQKIWRPEGAPMRIIMNEIKENLSQALSANAIPVSLGMNYGNPSIEQGIDELKQHQCEHIIVLPLFPQYSHTSTGSTFDRLEKLKEYTRVSEYATHPEYIQALAASVEQAWAGRRKSQQLLISFHGIPERYVAQGDPYATQCKETAKRLAEALHLSTSQWTLCYQSQFGYDKWLKPSTQELLLTLPKQGITDIDIICPGFAVDCLETLEEIAIAGQNSFLEAGGKHYHYIPALNSSDSQINLLKSLVHSITTC